MGSKRNQGMTIQTQLEVPTVPTIVVNLETELTSSRRARLSMNIGRDQYILDGNYQVLQGYGGEILIETPYESLRHVSIKGKLMMNTAKKMDAEIEVTYPTGNIRLVNVYDMLVDRPFGNMDVTWICHDIERCTMNLSFETTNGFIGKADLESIHLTHPISIKVSSQGNYVTEHRAEVIAAILGETHMVSIEYTMPRVTVVATSNIIGGSLRAEGSLTSELMSLTIAHALRTLEISADVSNGIRGSLSYKNDDVYKAIETVWTRIGYGFSGFAVINENNLEHRIEASADLAADSIDLKLSSPRLQNDVIVNAKFDLGHSRPMVEASYKYGQLVHAIKAGYAYSYNNAVSFILEIVTPFFELHKLAIKSDVQLSENLRADATFELFGEMHSFELRSDIRSRSSQRVTCTIRSPRIPGQIVKIDGDVSGIFP